MTDEEAMGRVQQGDKSAFAQIVENNKRILMVFCASYVKWDSASAEEVVQRTFIQAFKKAQKYDSTRPLKPWLFGVARNESLMYLRSLKRKPKASELIQGENLASLEPSPEKQASLDKDSQRLRSLLGHLPPKQAEVVGLNLQGLSHPEVAEIMGISQASVRNNLAHAIKALKKLMEPK